MYIKKYVIEQCQLVKYGPYLKKKNGIYKILIKLSLDYTHIKKLLFLLSKRGDRSSQRRIQECLSYRMCHYDILGVDSLLLTKQQVRRVYSKYSLLSQTYSWKLVNGCRISDIAIVFRFYKQQFKNTCILHNHYNPVNLSS